MTTVTLLPIYTASQQFNVNGVPLAGGKLHFYVAGSTTPKSTFSDYLGTIPYPNPIVLDSSGYLPGAIWVLPGGYKVLLTDADGNPIPGHDLDNVQFLQATGGSAVPSPIDHNGEVLGSDGTSFIWTTGGGGGLPEPASPYPGQFLWIPDGTLASVAWSDFFQVIGVDAPANVSGTRCIGMGSSGTAVGNNALAIGHGGYVGGDNSVTYGNDSQVSGDKCVAVGVLANTGGPEGNVAIGYNATTTDKNLSIALGTNGYVDSSGELSFNAGRFADFADSAKSIFATLRMTTLDTSPQVLATADSGSNQPTQLFKLADYSAYTFQFNIIARALDHTAKAWVGHFALTQASDHGEFRMLGTPSITMIGADVGSENWSVSVDVVPGGGIDNPFLITVQNTDGNTVYWVCTLWGTKVSASGF